MAFKLLQVLVLGVIAAAGDEDVPITWLSSRASLACEVPGADRIPTRRPPPPLDAEDQQRHKAYEWRRGDELLERVSSNGTLEVSRKRKDAEGLYQCLKWHAGGAVLGYPRNVKYAYMEKQVSVLPLNSTAYLGQPFVLTCDVSSGPAADVTWMKNSKPLPDDTRFYLLKNQLLISTVRADDAGFYRCKATNSIANKSRASHRSRLEVVDRPGDLELALLPNVQPETVIVAPRGSRVVLPCPFVGVNKPDLFWEFTAPGELTSELESVEEILVFPSVEFDQHGIYTCRPDGYSDPALVKMFNVTVTEPARIVQPPESRQAVRASTVRLSCVAAGRPAPRVSWYKDGSPLQLTRSIELVRSADDKKVPQLLIRGVTSEDAGIYQCFARNAVSVASAWAVLNVTGDEAAAPGSLQCWPVGARDIALRWNEVPDVIAYYVQTIMPDGRSLPGQPLNITNTTIRMKEALTPYSYQVRAFSQPPSGKKHVASDMSTTVTCQGQGVPIELMSDDDDSLQVSWKSFYTNNPGVVQWILQYRTENSVEEHNVTLDGNVYEYTLNVSPSSAVEVRVLGTRSLPWSGQELAHVAWSAPGAARAPPPGAMPTPIEVEVGEVNPRNFSLSWKCEEEDVSYTYLICVKKVGGAENVCVESYVTTASISQLQPDSQYEARVQARLLGHTAGGDFSPPVLVTTPPEDELEYAYTRGGVAVRWRGSGPRLVRYSQNLTQPLRAWRELNVTHNHVEITGLNASLPTFVIVASPDKQWEQFLNIKPSPVEATNSIYLYIGIGCGIFLLLMAVCALVCVWRRHKRPRSPARSPRHSSRELDDRGADLKNVGGRLANGGSSRDAGEPLLNGHVHITENPSQSKAPNGKVRRGRYEDAAFDLSRYEDADVTVETVLDDSLRANYHLETPRRRPTSPTPPRPEAAEPFNKLPDDNMNSEMAIHRELGVALPTLQPNG